MAATSCQIEALNFISDWSKWIAAVETGAIALIGAFVPKDGSPLGSAGYCIAVICFVVSILFAAAVLLALPASVQDIGEEEKVFSRVCVVGPLRKTLYWFVAAQFIPFLIGIVFFGMGVALNLIAGARHA